MRDLVRSKRNKEYCVQVPANVYLPDPQAILEAETPCELETRYDPLGLGLVPKYLDHETLYSKDEKHRKRTSLTLVVMSLHTGRARAWLWRGREYTTSSMKYIRATRLARCRRLVSALSSLLFAK